MLHYQCRSVATLRHEEAIASTFQGSIPFDKFQSDPQDLGRGREGGEERWMEWREGKNGKVGE